MKRRRPAQNPESAAASYSRALRWLTARELSEAQVRARLTEAGFVPDAIAASVDRLVKSGIIDDRRTAAAVARTEARVRRRGPRRVLIKLMSMGIDRDLAKDVMRNLFAEEDETSLLDRAIDRRLRGKVEPLTDPAERRKLIGYLVRQGFSASTAAAAIRNRARREIR